MIILTTTTIMEVKYKFLKNHLYNINLPLIHDWWFRKNIGHFGFQILCLDPLLISDNNYNNGDDN